jgi:nucleotide-binding universal stress UspA family protein
VRVLVPLDGSELAAKALPFAELLCRQLSAELHLVTVVPLLVIPYIGGQAYIPEDVYVQLEADRNVAANQVLEQAATAARAQGLQVQTHLARGDAAAALLSIASELQVALVVMTTHGRTGFVRFTLGSVADKVVRGGASPVLLVRSSAADSLSPHDIQLAHALVPLDGSPLAEEPLTSLVPVLAGSVLREVTLLRVADPRDGESGHRACETYLHSLRKRLVDLLGDRDCVISVLVRSNDNPAATIVADAENAQDGACDLVLMSTRGEAGIGRWAFGGVTDRVLRDGQIPLLLVQSSK